MNRPFRIITSLLLSLSLSFIADAANLAPALSSDGAAAVQSRAAGSSHPSIKTPAKRAKAIDKRSSDTAKSLDKGKKSNVHNGSASFWTPAFCSAIAALLSFAVALANFLHIKTSSKKEEKELLHKGLDTIIDISIQYPYLEQISFTERWNEQEKPISDERYVRYEVYNEKMFNFLFKLYEYYHGKSDKIEKFVLLKPWVKLHKQIWFDPIKHEESIVAYSKQFVNYIDDCIQSKQETNNE